MADLLDITLRFTGDKDLPKNTKEPFGDLLNSINDQPQSTAGGYRAPEGALRLFWVYCTALAMIAAGPLLIAAGALLIAAARSVPG